MFLAMRLEAESPPDPVCRRVGYPGFGGQGAPPPIGVGLGPGLEGWAQQGGPLLVADGPGGSGPGFLIEADEALTQEAPASLAHRGAGQTQSGGDAAVVKALGGQ